MSYSGLLFNRPMNKTVCEQAGAELKQIECKKPFYIGFFVAFFDKNNPVFWDKFWIPDKIYFVQPCYHPRDGHPPSKIWYLTFQKMDTHSPKDGHWSPNND